MKTISLQKKDKPMEVIELTMGQVKWVERPCEIKITGIGSCIGLFMYIPNTHRVGAAHIHLPNKYVNGQSPNATPKEAIGLILEEFKKKGHYTGQMAAKIVGGADILDLNIPIGTENANDTIAELLKYNIPLVSQDVGGRNPRTVCFSSENQMLKVKDPIKNQSQII